MKTRLEARAEHTRRSLVVEQFLCEPWIWCFAWELWEGSGAKPLPTGRDEAIAREVAWRMWKGRTCKVGDEVIANWIDEPGDKPSREDAPATVEAKHLEMAERIFSMLDAFMGAEPTFPALSEAQPAFAAGALPRVLVHLRGAARIFDSLTLSEEDQGAANAGRDLLNLAEEEALAALDREEEAGLYWPTKHAS